MRLLLFTISGLLCTLPAFADECTIPGAPEHWATDFCMYEIGADNIHEPEVKQCFEKQDYQSLAPCEAKKRYKEKICGIVGTYSNWSPENCMKDKTFSGPAVRSGKI